MPIYALALKFVKAPLRHLAAKAFKRGKQVPTADHKNLSTV
jgi:hypothetical protein